MGLSSVVISLYNYNFCGYEQGLAAHFSYLSNGRDRPQDRFLLAYSEHNRLLFRDLYLMHTYTESSHEDAISLIGKFPSSRSRGKEIGGRVVVTLFRISLALDGFWRVLEKVKKKGVC